MTKNLNEKTAEKFLDSDHDMGTDDFTSDEETRLIDKEKDVDKETKDEGRYPRSVFFIIGNEFCERFSYYGMRTILTIYLTQILLYGDDAATMIFHAFAMACYFTPIFGAMLADSYLGKFRTIFYISIIYSIGNVVISVGAIPQTLNIMNLTSIIGLALIAVGTGGIKPCVSAFGGDQFEPGQERYLQQFFSLFYMAINLGSVLSTFLTPILREDVSCFGQSSCFSLAFGVPAVLMVTSLILFLLGKSLYKMVPPSGNIVVKVTKCIMHALVKKWQRKNEKKEHWLDYASDKYEVTLIQDIKDVLHVLLLYLPLPIFWALFDQQGSRWTLQATRMNGEILGFNLKPDQIQVINPLLIIGFIPLFEYVVYPVLKKCHLLTRPLQKMTAGGLLAAASFIVAGFLEMHMEKTYPIPPPADFGELMVINNSPCSVKLDGSFETEFMPFQEQFLDGILKNETHTWIFTPVNCTHATESLTFKSKTVLPLESMMVTTFGSSLEVVKVPDLKEKSRKGDAVVRIFFNTPYQFDVNGSAAIHLRGDKTYGFKPFLPEGEKYGATKNIDIEPGKYEIFLPLNETAHRSSPVGSIEVKSGGTYIISIFHDEKNASQVTQKIFNIVEPNLVPMLYQIPQYVIITAGEIMFSVTGLEFSYSQAPKSMKSVLQAAWLLTVAFGNLIVLIIAELSIFEKQSYEFFMFATLMAVDMVIFAIMAFFYKYVNKASSGDTSKLEKGKSNDGYVEDTNF